MNDINDIDSFKSVINDICRVCCNKRNSLTSVFVKEGEIFIAEKIMSVTSVMISLDDKLPHSICNNCLNLLHECYKFKLECEKSDATLRSRIYKEKIDSESGNLDACINTKFNLSQTKGGTCNQREELHKKTLQQKYNSKSIKTDNPEIEDGLEDCDHPKQFIEQYTISPAEVKCSLEEPVLSEKPYNDGNVQEKIIKPKPQKEQCPTCGRVMSSRFRLKMHLRTHTGEKPFTCLYCNKTFTLAQNLKVHQRVHTGEKPLRCSICGKSFAQSAGLVTHHRLHSGETPYHCTLCSASFRTPGHLQYHIRRHTGEKKFECETCRRSFITRSDLKQHVQTHTGERLHVCCVCGIRLARASHLKRHMAIHNGPRPFACEVCSSTFLQKTDLQKHIKKHASTETDTAETIEKENGEKI